MTMPTWFNGSLPEWLVYDSLLKMGLKDKFTFQSSRMGVRLSSGTRVDFDLPELGRAINVRKDDALERAQIKSKGTDIVFIREADAMADAPLFVEDALKGLQH